jgi:hypothetical protein
MDTNEFNKLTGVKLNPGESYVDAQGQTITQGSVITPQSLVPQPQINLNTPAEFQTQPPTVEGDMAFFNQLQNQQTQEQQMLQAQQTGKNNELENLLRNLGGQGAEQLSLEQQIVNPIQSQITDIMGQFGVKQAEYQKALQDYEKLKTDLEVGVRGSGNADIRASMLFGQQGAVDRAKAADLNVRASEMGILQAQALALQGKADLAQKQIDRAVDLKYKAIENEIAIKQFQLGLIRDSLTKAEKKQADALNFALQRDEKRIAEEKQKEKDIQSIAMQLASFGVDPSIIKDARTVNEALQMAGKNLQDPRQKYEIAKLKAETEKAQTETFYLNLYGGMTPSQYASYLKDQKEAIQEAKTEEEKSRLQGEALGETVTLMEGILTSPGMAASVGTTGLTRTGGGRILGATGTTAAGATAGTAIFPGIGTVLGGIAGLATGLYLGSPSETRGDKQNFIGSVEQMISQKFLANLIDVKAQGGTFGALQKAEQDALTESATKIGNWRIREGNKPDGAVIGYNIDENNFKKEMETILRITKIARERATGKQFTPDEQAQLDAGFGVSSNGTALSPGQFFNQ